MDWQGLPGWIAPVATTIAAMMTAANLGSRVTGWGFALFVIASICWSLVGVATGQTNLLWTNGFLTVVNAIGVWRWLGRQARYDDGGVAAARRSAASRVPTLFSASAMIGSPVKGSAGETIGAVVDSMAECASARLAYVVVSEGGVAGVGERLHAIDPSQLTFSAEGVQTSLSAADLAATPVLAAKKWPATLPE